MSAKLLPATSVLIVFFCPDGRRSAPFVHGISVVNRWLTQAAVGHRSSFDEPTDTLWNTPCLSLPEMSGLFRKKSRLPVAASAYWSIATMIA
jgi:hypothetical protein